MANKDKSRNKNNKKKNKTPSPSLSPSPSSSSSSSAAPLSGHVLDRHAELVDHGPRPSALGVSAPVCAVEQLANRMDDSLQLWPSFSYIPPPSVHRGTAAVSALKIATRTDSCPVPSHLPGREGTGEGGRAKGLAAHTLRQI